MIRRIIFSFLLLLVLLGFFGCGNRVELLSDISESEGNEAISVLLTAGISSSKIPRKDGLVSIDVEHSQVARAIAILGEEGLPRERFVKMGDVFRKEGLISSPLEERARYIWALSQELSATLSQIDGVIKARVHVVLPEKTGGGEPSLPSSAAVFIKHKQGITLEDSVVQIKRLVSNSIPGLSSDKVTVVMLTSMVRLTRPDDNVRAAQNAKGGISQKEELTLNVSGKGQDIYFERRQLIVIFFILVASLVSIMVIFSYRQLRKKKSNADAQSSVTPT